MLYHLVILFVKAVLIIEYYLSLTAPSPDGVFSKEFSLHTCHISDRHVGQEGEGALAARAVTLIDCVALRDLGIISNSMAQGKDRVMGKNYKPSSPVAEIIEKRFWTFALGKNVR